MRSASSEAIGSSSPLLDAEVVAVAHRAFAAMGLRNYRVHLNSIGDRDDRAAFREVLRAAFAAQLPERCDDCRRRYERNVFHSLFATEDQKEGMAAFVGKKKPVFRHR